uniref:Transposase-associated domain-containing protein n=1 Tax=Cajanus cajan TaxID=3821 RepID=A0A151T4Z4_CAJCA|nr:hypothetical protein KK1_016627 [Cajanus cajan]
MNSKRITNEYQNGVEQFLEFAQRNQSDLNRKFYCPCVNCLNGRRRTIDEIWDHLICDGFLTSYTTWIWHGEHKEIQIVYQTQHDDEVMHDQIEDMIRDVGQESFQQAHSHVYDDLKSDSETPLFPDCITFTRLSAVLRLMNLKARNGWSDKSFIKMCGPVYLRWMYPIERYVKILKGYSKNPYCPEASIVERYIAKEAIEFCPEYMSKEKPVGLPKSRHEDRCEGQGTKGLKVKFILRKELLQAHLYILNNTNEFSFYTKSQDDNITMQNSGVTLQAQSMHFSSRNDKNHVVASTSYYGVIEEIWEINYTKFKVPIFKCKWVDINTGVRTDEMGFTMVNFSKVSHISYVYLVDFNILFIIFSCFNLIIMLYCGKKILQHVSTRFRQYKSFLTRVWINRKQKGNSPCGKYNIDLEDWEKFKQIRNDPKWQNELDEQASQGSFVIDGRQDILNTALGRLEHPGRVRTAGVGTPISQYYGRRQSHGLSIAKLTPKDLELLTQQVVAQLKKNDISNTQTQDVLLVQVDLVLGSSKGSCPTPSSATVVAGNELGDKPHVRELCIDDIPPRVVAIGRVYEGSSTIHHVPLTADLVKVVVEFVRDFDAHVPMPTSEVQLVGQALQTFISWPRRLVRHISSSKKTQDILTVHRSKPSNDPICDLREASLTLTYGNPFKVICPGSLFGVGANEFVFYITFDDIRELIERKMLNISIIQFWMLNHWQLLVLCPMSNVAVWFCSLHHKPIIHVKHLVKR